MYFIMLGQMVLSGEKHMANWALEGFLSSVDFLLVWRVRLLALVNTLLQSSHRCALGALGDQNVPADVA